MTTTLTTVRVDRTAEKRLLAAYRPQQVDVILRGAAKHGADDAAKVLRSDAPIGTSERQGQYYRRMGLPHGTFRKSVRAAAIRGRGSAIAGLQARTVGQVIGPMGKNAFTRAWRELGTTHARATHWMAQVAAAVLAVAQRGSEAVLVRYSRDH